MKPISQGTKDLGSGLHKVVTVTLNHYAEGGGLMFVAVEQ